MARARWRLPAVLVVASLAGCASSPLTGTWTGTTDAQDATSMPARLVLVEDSSGVTGTVLATFPGGGDFVEVDTVSGTRTGDSIHLVGATGLTLDLTRTGVMLAGSVTFSLASTTGDPVVGSLTVTKS